MSASEMRASGGQWMSTFEYRADMRDLALDGRHWRAQFGGSSGPGPKMGGYVCCGPLMYVFFRLVTLATAAGIFYTELVDESGQLGLQLKWYLYFEHLTLLVALGYFALAFLLTLFAVCASGKEASHPPLLVLVCWICYGILIPASLACMLMWVFVTQRAGEWISLSGDPEETCILTPVGVWALVYLDLYVNRQPYYASFHGFCGILFCWGYLLFNIVYTQVLEGTDPSGDPYVYRQLNWRQYMSAGKLVMLQLFILLPYFNALYWGVVWARRRARVAAKHSAV